MAYSDKLTIKSIKTHSTITIGGFTCSVSSMVDCPITTGSPLRSDCLSNILRPRWKTQMDLQTAEVSKTYKTANSTGT